MIKKTVKRSKLAIILALLLVLLPSALALAAPKKQLVTRWVVFNPLSKKTVDYSAWADFLKKYTVVKKDHVLVRYAAVSAEDKAKLARFIQQMEQVPVDALNRPVQMAYWINLYNAETVYLVLQHYPVKSILAIKKGFFSRGPWDMPVLKLQGVSLTLNTIEHGILRPIWNDPRVHAALNCASLSCPNLRQTPYTGSAINQQLNQAFRDFINTPWGLQVKGKTLVLSKIFSWYKLDFGDSNAGLLHYMTIYASAKLKKQLATIKTIRFANYNWQLNQAS